MGALALGLTLTLVANPHRSLSALVPDSFSPWVHVSPAAMLERRAALREAVALIPDQVQCFGRYPRSPLAGAAGGADSIPEIDSLSRSFR